MIDVLPVTTGMKAFATLLLFGVWLSTATFVGATELQPIPKPVMIERLSKLVETSEVVAVVSVSNEPTRIRLEVTDLLLSRHGNVSKGSVAEKERGQPNDGAHPSFRALAFFPKYPLKIEDSAIYPLHADRLQASPAVSLDDVKTLIAKKNG